MAENGVLDREYTELAYVSSDSSNSDQFLQARLSDSACVTLDDQNGMDTPDDPLQWLPDSLRTALDDLRNNGCKSESLLTTFRSILPNFVLHLTLNRCGETGTAAKATAAGVVLGAVARSLHRGMQVKTSSHFAAECSWCLSSVTFTAANFTQCY